MSTTATPFVPTLNPNVPSDVSTAFFAIAAAVQVAATVPGKDDRYAASKIGEFEAFINSLYRA